MINNALDNIFKDKVVEKRICTVVTPSSTGMYKVKDSQGKQFDVFSSTAYKAGDGVVVNQNKEIIGRAAIVSSPKVFVV